MDKYGICVDCSDGIEKPLIAGRCKAYHYSIYRKKLILEKQKEKQKVRSLINSKPNKELLVKNDKIVDENLELWFRLQMNSNEKICDNCKMSLNHYQEKDWRGSQHHVLEKSIFKSVMSNPINHLVLCRWKCHVLWHSSMLVASKMPCFEKAKEIVTLLYPLLTDREKGRISEYYNLLPNS